MPMVQMVMMTLSPEELEIRKNELAKLPAEIEMAEEVANAERSKHREKIEDLKKRRDQLIAVVTSAREPRERKIEERPGLVNGAVELVDVVTGEVVEPVKVAPSGDGPLFDKDKVDKKRTAKKGEKGKLDVADNRKKDAAPGQEFSINEPAIGIGDDGKEYPLDAKDADIFRNKGGIIVQGEKGQVEILELKKAPKGAKAKKSSGAAEVQP